MTSANPADRSRVFLRRRAFGAWRVRPREAGVTNSDSPETGWRPFLDDLRLRWTTPGRGVNYALVMPHPRDYELARLVEEGSVDEVLSIVSLATIADTWCAFHAVDHDWDAVGHDVSDEPDWWAVEFILDGVTPDLRQDTLLALVASAHGDSRVLSVIGAGPFEDYLDAFDPDHIEWIEHNSSLSSSFQEALRNMRVSEALPDNLRIRINCAAGLAPDRRMQFDP